MEDNSTLTPIPLSELPILDEDTGDFWIFCSKENVNGIFNSGRFNLSEYLKLAEDSIQLERRISLNMETNTHTMFVGEAMTIYKVNGSNVSSLIINNADVPLDSTDMPIDVPEKSFVNFTIERELTDPTAYLYVYARVKVTE